MTLTLTRTNCTPDGIFGILSDESGSRLAFTLEHSYDCVPKIPTGTFECVRGEHALHSGPIETFEVTGVAGHSGILFHYGNYNADSDGCILLGEGESAEMVTESRQAFFAFIAKTTGLDSFTLVVT